MRYNKEMSILDGPTTNPVIAPFHKTAGYLPLPAEMALVTAARSGETLQDRIDAIDSAVAKVKKEYPHRFRKWNDLVVSFKELGDLQLARLQLQS